LYAEKNKSELNVGLYFKATFIIYAEDATDIFLRHRVRHGAIIYLLMIYIMQGTKHAKLPQVSEVAACPK